VTALTALTELDRPFLLDVGAVRVRVNPADVTVDPDDTRVIHRGELVSVDPLRADWTVVDRQP
jgi:hypothetical protein